MHSLSEFRVALVDEHNLTRVLILLAVDLLVADCDAVQLLHVLLACDVTACDALFLEVDGDAAAWDEISGCDLVVRVVRTAEEFTSLFVEEVLVHG